MDLSVVICTHNNAERLRSTLAAMQKCSLPDRITWEVVVVANACTDHTDTVISRYDNILPVRLVHEHALGISKARNAAWQNSRGDLLIWADDDVIPSSSWLQAYWDAYCRHKKAFFGGKIISDYETKPPPKDLQPYCMASVVGLDLGPLEKEVPHQGFLGNNWASPRVALAEVNGFDLDIGFNNDRSGPKIGEESELMNRLEAAGYIRIYVPQAAVHHFVPAAKTTLSHIGKRTTEIEFGKYLRRPTEKDDRSTKIRGVPRWLVRMYCVSRVRFYYRLIMGIRDYAEYFEGCRLLGMIKAYSYWGKSTLLL